MKPKSPTALIAGCLVLAALGWTISTPMETLPARLKAAAIPGPLRNPEPSAPLRHRDPTLAQIAAAQ